MLGNYSNEKAAQ